MNKRQKKKLAKKKMQYYLKSPMNFAGLILGHKPSLYQRKLIESLWKTNIPKYDPYILGGYPQLILKEPPKFILDSNKIN